KADAVASSLGLAYWDARHDSAAFRFTRSFALTAMGNTLAFWKRERWGIELTSGIDEVSLALVADAWSRTYRSRALTFSREGDVPRSRPGMRFLPDRSAASWPVATRLPAIERPPAEELDKALQGIADRYGARTAAMVAMQLEYPH